MSILTAFVSQKEPVTNALKLNCTSMLQKIKTFQSIFEKINNLLRKWGLVIHKQFFTSFIH